MVCIATEAAERPSGTVSGACRTMASREGAFRLLESRAISSEAVVAAAASAGARRCAGYSRVIVALDATSLSLTNRPRGDLGAVGSWKQGARGVHVMTALALAPDGAPLGICAQKYWSRTQRSTSSHRRRRHADEPTESRSWTEVLDSARSHLAAADPQCTPWFQLDRGADCWDVLTAACRDDLLLTVRATHDRRLDGEAGHLWQALEKAPIRATRTIAVNARPPKRKRQRVGQRRYRHWMAPAQPARQARVDIRAARVSLQLRNCSGHRADRTEIHAVWVQERGRHGERIEWMLLTTHSIKTRRDVLAVVDAYALRWRVEEFHRTWKRGLCRVEDTQLRSASAVCKWATILATVATRAMALSRAARSTPEVPATEHLTPLELQAILALRRPKGAHPNLVPSLAQAVRWIADIGGYVGPWNGPAGPKVIGRGLYDVLVVARALDPRDKKR